jgi:hypothetical protein
MNTERKFWIYEHYLALSVLFGVAIAILFLIFVPNIDGFRLLLTILGGVFSFIFFMQRQQLEEMKSFKELYKDFNKRYDDLNEDLNSIARKEDSHKLKQEEIDTLYDYFNLCSEEYLYYKKGYIYPEVWTAWANGINFFLSHPIIRGVWKREEKTDSYYNLTLDEIQDYSTFDFNQWKSEQEHRIPNASSE